MEQSKIVKEKALKIDDISITLYKSKRAKRMSISLKPFVGVRVSVPRLTPFWMAERFVTSRIDWIKDNLPKMELIENQQTIFTEESDFKTKTHELLISKHDSDELKLSVHSNKINIKYPKSMNVSDDTVQQEVRKGIERALRKEAKEYLPKRLDELAQQSNLEFKALAIKNTKTRWGSCSHQNNINLNLHLMRLPNRLIDYVILHELAHTKVKNHSKYFWNFLESILPNSKELDREMKEYNTKIY